MLKTVETYKTSANRIRNSENESAPTVFLHESERLRVPTVIDVGRLHIQVTVDTHGFLLWVRTQLAQNDGR